MPSEPRTRLAWLRSQGLGLLCGQLTVLLLGVGSVILVRTRETDSAGIQFDDLRGFFSPWSWTHWWFYALLIVVALYALNTVLCTWDSVLAKWRRGTREPSAWAPAVIHVSFLIALLAHAVGGFFNEEGAPLTVTRSWTRLDAERQIRLLDLTTETTASGKTRQVHARIESEDRAGHREQGVVEYNGPWSRGLGSELLLIAQVGRLPGLPTFSIEGATCTVAPDATCSIGDVELQVTALHEGGHWGGRPAAILTVRDPAGLKSFPLLEGNSQTLPGGKSLRFDGVTSQEAVSLRHRHAPGNAVAAVSALLLALGLGLMGRRWLL